jgi:RNA polymerase sigma factor (sigma-70 family)
MPSLRGPSALLRLQSDERLIALTRRGNPAAFEVVCARYQARLLAFCRHMLSSREDAEDVLQEVFAAAYNAVLGDEREINVRPWLYRIARNRSLNHLRRVAPIGVDTMDVHYADSGLTTSDKVLRRESFRELIADVQDLPETQRTALLLREIDALSYEQIAHAMETTVPSVKSLLVRARISLAEAAEARKLSCEEVRLELGEAAEGLGKLSTPGRRHVRGCERCRSFRKHLKSNNRALAAIMPVAPLFLAKKLLLTKLGSTASAGGAHVAGGAGATMGAGASAAGASATAGAGAAAAGGGVSFAGGVVTAGAGAIATKAVAGLAAAAIVTAGAVAADHAVAPVHRHTTASQIYAAVPAQPPAVPQVVQQRLQPASNGVPPARLSPPSLAALKAAAAKKAARDAKPTAGPGAKAAPATLTATSTASPTTAPTTPTTPAPATPGAGKVALGPKTPEKVTEVTSESTQLPSSATAPPSATREPAPASEALPGTSSPGAPAVTEPQSGGTPAPSAEEEGAGTEGTPSG